MVRTLSTLAMAVVMAAAAWLQPAPARAADEVMQISSAAELSGRVVNLALNKSIVLDMPEQVRDVLVSNPAVADAVVRSNQKIYFIGMGIGETNIFLFGDGGREIAHFELVVSRDVVGLQALINRVLPGGEVVANTIGDSIVLSGNAANSESATKAVDLASKFIGDPAKVVNMLSVAGGDQVHLKVVVAEVERETIRNLGVQTESLLQATVVDITQTTGIKFATDLALSSPLSSLIQMLNEKRVIRTLAEPTLTAISGEEANFLAGGEFPIPVPSDDNKVTIEYKKFGISLSFRPVVLSTGRISLQVLTEVSELSDIGAVEINGFRIPSLSVRRASSTVELPSGGSIVMAGLIRDDIRQRIAGFPGLMDLPVLGTLFKSREYKRNQTELAIFVSPYIVKAVKPGQLQRPDQNFNVASDAQGLFLNQINKVYRPQGKAVNAPYYGRYGFSYE